MNFNSRLYRHFGFGLLWYFFVIEELIEFSITENSRQENINDPFSAPASISEGKNRDSFNEIDGIHKLKSDSIPLLN